ncbi:E2AK2 kinase, partial [Alectura lathami]|nr:E2AK2 kinase [Alectura lathami]
MEWDCVSKINSYCQRKSCKPDYVEVDRKGPSHNPEFTVMLKIGDKEYGTGTGKTKKEAKAAAAKKAWEIIKQQDGPPTVGAREPVASPVDVETLPPLDAVSRLNIYSQKTSKIVDYTNINRTGDAHAPIFFCSCTIDGRVYGNGTGNTVAAAKQAAAQEACEKVKEKRSLTACAKKHCIFLFMIALLSPKIRLLFFHIRDVSFKDSSASLVEKAKDMPLSEEPSPSQRNVRSSAVKSKRILAANFGNARNNEQKKAMSDSYESLSDSFTNSSEGDGNEYTVDERFFRAYKNIEPIGEGGFGNVFKATARTDEMTYAVKRVQLTENGLREVKELARLQHENIVRYFCSWEGSDYMTYPDSRKKSNEKVPCVFIQMEFCEQGPLENWIENNRHNRNYNEMAQDKFLQILNGVDYIHSKGLIHRDLKPQNIFLSHKGEIKIGDFGLVTSINYEIRSENRGTKSYMAPEQVTILLNEYGKEVDIYALGLIWFEMLSALASRHEKSKVWSEVRKGNLPGDFTKKFKTQVPIIKRMLSEDSSERFSASYILDILKSVDKDNSHKAHSY